MIRGGPGWALLLIAFSACDATPDRPDRDPRSRPRPRPTESATSLAPGALPPLPTASASATGEGLAGTWEGRYEAVKGNVGLPAKVKDKALEADDGKAASGTGTIELTIDAAGELRGKGSGALGPMTLGGRAEEGMIRALVSPADPRAPGAMTGVLVAILKGSVIKGEIRVAGPDATVIRESPIELKRK